MKFPWFSAILTVLFSISFALSVVYIPSDTNGWILKILLLLLTLFWLVVSIVNIIRQVKPK